MKCPAKARYAGRELAMEPSLNGFHSEESPLDRPLVSTVAVIGAPSCLGAPGPGPEAAPAILRAAGLLDRLRTARVGALDWGDVPVPTPEPHVEGTIRNEGALVALAKALSERVGSALDSSLTPLVLGGDHSISLGSIAASAARGPVGVLWLDAHGDFNTPETSPSGLVYGMVLAILAGLGPASLVELGPRLPANRIAILGARALDADERKLLVQNGVAVYTTQAIRALGPDQAVARAIDGLRAAGAERIHVSLDLDVIDPTEAPGVWTRAGDGLTLEETRAALRAVARTRRMVALDVTELFPTRDPGGVTTRAALSLIKAALAQKSPVQALDWRMVQAGLRSSA